MVMSSLMDSISIAEANADLSEIVDRAASGEAVQITRRGKPDSPRRSP
jgi:prevent-host-death family protein